MMAINLAAPRQPLPALHPRRRHSLAAWAACTDPSAMLHAAARHGNAADKLDVVETTVFCVEASMHALPPGDHAMLSNYAVVTDRWVERPSMEGLDKEVRFALRAASHLYGVPARVRGHLCDIVRSHVSWADICDRARSPVRA